MPRAKKDGQHLNCYIDRVLRERLEDYAEEKGQTLTMAVERLLTKALDAEEKKEASKQDARFFRTFCSLGGKPTQKLEEVAHPKLGVKTEIPQKSWKESLGRNEG